MFSEYTILDEDKDFSKPLDKMELINTRNMPIITVVNNEFKRTLKRRNKN